MIWIRFGLSVSQFLKDVLINLRFLYLKIFFNNGGGGGKVVVGEMWKSTLYFYVRSNILGFGLYLMKNIFESGINILYISGIFYAPYFIHMYIYKVP